MAAIPLVLCGCAAKSVVLPEVGTPETVGGQISGEPGRRGFVVAAPHGTSDPLTGEIAAEVARRTGFGLVVAHGFSLEAAGPERRARRYQVNRPLEGVPGRPPNEEVPTDAARRVYETYERRVRDVAQGPLVLLVEIHGNGRLESATRIEIATVGIDPPLAERLRTLFELIRDAHLRGQPAAPRLAVLVEPADTLRYTASGAKRAGILRLPERGLHVELPRAARREWRAVYTEILSDFLVEMVALRPVS